MIATAAAANQHSPTPTAKPLRLTRNLAQNWMPADIRLTAAAAAKISPEVAAAIVASAPYTGLPLEQGKVVMYVWMDAMSGLNPLAGGPDDPSVGLLQLNRNAIRRGDFLDVGISTEAQAMEPTTVAVAMAKRFANTVPADLRLNISALAIPSVSYPASGENYGFVFDTLADGRFFAGSGLNGVCDSLSQTLACP